MEELWEMQANRLTFGVGIIDASDENLLGSIRWFVSWSIGELEGDVFASHIMHGFCQHFLSVLRNKAQHS